MGELKVLGCGHTKMIFFFQKEYRHREVFFFLAAKICFFQINISVYYE